MRVLFATDGSRHARAGMGFLSRIPLPKRTRVRVLHVREPSGPDSLSRRDLVEDARPLEEAGWQVAPLITEGTPISEQVLRSAEEFEADLIVVASRGKSRIQRFLLGSVTHRVAEYASCSVLVTRLPVTTENTPASDRSGLRVLLAFDGSESAVRALRWLQALPPEGQLEVKVLTVLQLLTMYRMDVLETTSPFWIQEREASAAQLSRVEKTLRESGLTTRAELRESGDPSGEIARVAREMAADLIVVGDRGRSPISKALLGSVADRVLHYGPCSVLIVRASRRAPEDAG